MTDEQTIDILILGGGTAGWMAASLMAHSWREKPVRITLLESSDIGTIGVGEGSTPRMRAFFDRLEIPESEWMPACNATYKCGIRFPGWVTKPGFESYYHPFFTQSDNDSVAAFRFNVDLRRNKNVQVPSHPDTFFVSNYLARGRRAPKAPSGSGYETDYAYHFDAGRIGVFLKKKSLEWGVRHVVDTVTDVDQSETGEIQAVNTKEQGRVDADFFIDCTGFASLLISKTLGVPFHSYASTMFNDSAVALPSALPEDGKLPSETLSKAMKNGWSWRIPLTNRFGNGYVYSSSHCSADDAETELRRYIGVADDVEARHLKMRIGRMDRSWEKNCLAVGLSQGFLEPLEATALMIVQHSVETFIKCFEEGGFTNQFQSELNDNINRNFDGVHDYIFMHYKINTRVDTPYWRDNRENEAGPELAMAILQTWDRGEDLLQFLKENLDRLVYSPTSWYCILAGMGRFPPQARKPKAKLSYAHESDIRMHCQQKLSAFRDHREVIEEMAAAGVDSKQTIA